MWVLLYMMRLASSVILIIVTVNTGVNMKAKTTCKVAGCDRGRPIVNGLCSMHYQRKARLGQVRLNKESGCIEEGCEQPYYAKSRCINHYMCYNRRLKKEKLKEERYAARNDVPCKCDDCKELA